MIPELPTMTVNAKDIMYLDNTLIVTCLYGGISGCPANMRHFLCTG